MLWAGFYGVLLSVFLFVSYVQPSPSRSSSHPSGIAIAITGVLFVWWAVGPMVQVVRRRQEIMNAISVRRHG